jgi:hypothetical protein
MFHTLAMFSRQYTAEVFADQLADTLKRAAEMLFKDNGAVGKLIVNDDIDETVRYAQYVTPYHSKTHLALVLVYWDNLWTDASAIECALKMYRTMTPERANTDHRGLMAVVGPRTSKTADPQGAETSIQALQTAMNSLGRMLK